MYRRTLFVGLLALCSVVASGCYLYLDDDDDDRDDGPGGYSYCDEERCYWCDDYGCYPDGTDPGGTGWECDNDYDCAAGCYCDPDTGTCQEGGFCTNDDECPEGYECDDRSSCVPSDPDDECTEDSQCETGSFCDESTGQCVPSTECTNDEQCPDGQTCDEERGTCIPAPCDENSDCPTGSYCDLGSGQCVDSSACGPEGECPDGMECDSETNTCVPDLPDPATCQGEVTCDEAPPSCPEGTNPGIVNGCYNGECIADEDCPDGAPVYCSDHTAQADCLADDSCEAIYRGLNCTDPDGVPCTEEEANCTCESFTFYECVDPGTPTP